MADDFQARASSEGRAAQDIAARVLSGAGFVEVERNVKLDGIGVTVNCVGKDGAGQPWYFDVVGSFTSDRAGLIRTDSVWKALGRASVLNQSDRFPLVLLTTNLPKSGSVGERAMIAASGTFFDALEIPTEASKARLREYARGGVDVALPGLVPATNLYPSLTPRHVGFGPATGVSLDDISPYVPASTNEYDATAYPHRMKVIVPSKDSDGNDLPALVRKKGGERIISLMSKEAGGCTGMEAFGAWIDPIGGVMHEQVATIESYSPMPFSDALIAGVVRVVVDDLEQHTAAIILDDVMYQVTAT